jgi:hypothetical protein
VYRIVTVVTVPPIPIMLENYRDSSAVADWGANAPGCRNYDIQVLIPRSTGKPTATIADGRRVDPRDERNNCQLQAGEPAMPVSESG